MKSLVRKFLFALLVSASGLASAGPLTGLDVPGNLTVLRNGLEWAWASPCAPSDPSCGQTPLVMHHGFEIATANDFLGSFSGLVDLYNAFDGGRKCAAAYFNSGYSHCDGADVDPSGFIAVWNLPVSWGQNYETRYFDEVFVVRGTVSEPGALALLGLGLFGLFAARRKVS